MPNGPILECLTGPFCTGNAPKCTFACAIKKRLSRFGSFDCAPFWTDSRGHCDLEHEDRDQGAGTRDEGGRYCALSSSLLLSLVGAEVDLALYCCPGLVAGATVLPALVLTVLVMVLVLTVLGMTLVVNERSPNGKRPAGWRAFSCDYFKYGRSDELNHNF